VAVHVESDPDFLGQRRGRRHHIRQVHDEVAAPADEVGMVAGVDIVTGHLVEGIDLNDETLLTKNLQGLVHGVKRDGWHIAPDFLVDLVSGGMIPASLQVR
jgi:hypothetical protein